MEKEVVNANKIQHAFNDIHQVQPKEDTEIKNLNSINSERIGENYFFGRKSTKFTNNNSNFFDFNTTANDSSTTLKVIDQSKVPMELPNGKSSVTIDNELLKSKGLETDLLSFEGLRSASETQVNSSIQTTVNNELEAYKRNISEEVIQAKQNYLDQIDTGNRKTPLRENDILKIKKWSPYKEGYQAITEESLIENKRRELIDFHTNNKEEKIYSVMESKASDISKKAEELITDRSLYRKSVHLNDEIDTSSALTSDLDGKVYIGQNSEPIRGIDINEIDLKKVINQDEFKNEIQKIPLKNQTQIISHLNSKEIQDSGISKTKIQEYNDILLENIKGKSFNDLGFSSTNDQILNEKIADFNFNNDNNSVLGNIQTESGKKFNLNEDFTTTKNIKNSISSEYNELYNKKTNSKLNEVTTEIQSLFNLNNDQIKNEVSLKELHNTNMSIKQLEDNYEPGFFDKILKNKKRVVQNYDVSKLDITQNIDKGVTRNIEMKDYEKNYFTPISNSLDDIVNKIKDKDYLMINEDETHQNFISKKKLVEQHDNVLKGVENFLTEENTSFDNNYVHTNFHLDNDEIQLRTSIQKNNYISEFYKKDGEEFSKMSTNELFALKNKHVKSSKLEKISNIENLLSKDASNHIENLKKIESIKTPHLNEFGASLHNDFKGKGGIKTMVGLGILGGSFAFVNSLANKSLEERRTKQLELITLRENYNKRNNIY